MLRKLDRLKGQLLKGTVAALMLFGTAGAAMAQRYVLYSSDYGYLYNNNGSLRSTNSLQYNKSSVWNASGALGTTSQTITSYTSGQYLYGNGYGNNNTVTLSTNSNNWQLSSNYLFYKRNYSNTTYWLTTSNGTSFSVNSGASASTRFIAYEITSLEDISTGFNNLSISSGQASISATGTYNYTHTNATYYSTDYVDYVFSSTHHYVNSSNAVTTSDPGTTVSSSSAYTWSLSDNATGYATVNASTGAVTVSAIPEQKTTITLICTCTYSGQTATASINITLSLTGVSGGVVTLDDREDHSWAYYSDENCPVRSLNPADVKITYHGKGTNTVSTTNGATPASSSWAANATTVQVSNSEADSVFVYYKTLERLDGSRSNNPTGYCAYNVIPNPFCVRPTYSTGYGTGSNNTYTGFHAWRIKDIKNGKIYTDSVNGTLQGKWTSGNVQNSNILYADRTYYFLPDDEYGMEVELEALWARAYVVTSNTTTGLSSDVTYERNFIVLSSNTTLRAAALNIPATYTTLDPATCTGTKRTITIRDGFTCSNDTKFENLTFAQYNNNDQTITAAEHDLIFGRGLTGTINYVSGASGDATDPDYTLRIESGVINYLSIMRGYSYGSGNSDVSDNGGTVGGTPTIKAVLGCDYDRASNSDGITNNFIIQYGAFYGYSVSENSLTYSDKAVKVYVKSGKIGNSITINNSYTANAHETFYIGNAGQRLRGHRQLFIEGGELASVAGGIDNANNQTRNSLTIRMTGGHVRGAIYGGGARSAGYGNRNLIFTGGTINGWIGGGCNGEAYPSGQTSEDTYGGITYGSSKVYFGGTAICGGTGSNITINGSIGGTVFGAGKGVEGNTTSGRMSEGTTVVVADNCSIERNVYGGGNFGYAQTSTNVYINGGTVHGDIFGGSNQNNGPDIDITMKAGTIDGGLYGGCNVSGNVSGHINIDIYGTDPHPSSGYAVNQVFGGGNLAAYSGTPNVTVHCGTDQTTPISIGELYGGGNEADVTGTNVTIEAGNIIGDVYGGGRQANVGNGGTSVAVHGGTIRRVFGGNNISGTIAGGNTDNKISVSVDKTSSCPMMIGQVYGGGNEADSRVGNITIGCTGTLTDAHRAVAADAGATPPSAIGYTLEGIGDVYGGANNATITGNVTLNINSGIIYRVFGANNTGKKVTGTITVNIAKNSGATCASDWYVGYVFGGGNNAPYGTAGNNYPAVNHTAGKVTYNVYGGGKGNTAIVTGNPQVTLDGTAEVGGNVYGGGDAAPVTGSTKVTLKD